MVQSNRLNRSILLAAASMVAACAHASAGPPVQYEKVSLVGEMLGGILVEKEKFKLGPDGRLFARVTPATDPLVHFSDGVYVRDEGAWSEIVPSRSLDLGLEWGVEGIPVIIEGGIAVAARRGWTSNEYAILEFAEAGDGSWAQSVVMQVPAGERVSNLSMAGGEYRWSDFNQALFRLLGGAPEKLLDMQAALGTIVPNYRRLSGSFQGISSVDQILIRVSDTDGIFGEDSLYLWPLDATMSPERLASHLSDDQGSAGMYLSAMNSSGGLLLLNRLYGCSSPLSCNIAWSPVSAGLTPGFEVPLVPGSAFVSFERLPPAVNLSGRVMFNAIRADGKHGLFIGPDTVADAIWLEGEMIFGSQPQVVFTSGLSEQGHFIARLKASDGTIENAVGTICPADVNRDGVFDNGDIGEWVNLYLDGSLRTDFNNDGLLDNGDIGEFITQFLDGC